MLILVPLDGSKVSDRALPAATELARRYQARLLLVSVVDLPELVVRHDLSSSEADSHVQTARLRGHLERTQNSLQRQGFEADVLVDYGRAAERLLEIAERQGADLIVLSSHSKGPKRWLLGSVADKVARHSPCPVLMVRGRWDHFQRFLVPLDGAPESERSLEVARTLVQPESSLAVITVSEIPEPVFSESDLTAGWRDSRQRDEREQARLYLEKILPRLPRGARVHPLQGEPAEVILEEAEKADLVILTARSQGWLSRHIFGSVTERVMHHSPCPVLIVRGPAGKLESGDLRRAEESRC